MIRKIKNSAHISLKENYTSQGDRCRPKYKKISIQSVRQQIQSTPSVPYQQEWEQTYQRRESSLNAMFNKRKGALEDISKQNKHIYIKISNQESHYCFPKIAQQNSLRLKDTPSINSKELIKISKTVMGQAHLPNCQLLPIHQNQQHRITSNKDTKIRSEQYVSSTEQICSSLSKGVQSRYEGQGIMSFNSERIGNKHQNRSKLGRVNDIYLNF